MSEKISRVSIEFPDFYLIEKELKETEELKKAILKKRIRRKRK